MKRDYAILLWVLLAVLLLPHFITKNYYFTVCIIIGIYSILVIGLNLLMGYAGQVSLGHAAFFALGAYFSGVLTAKYGWNPWPAAGVAIAATSLVAMLIGIPTLKLEGHYLAMATLGIGVIIQKFLQMDKVSILTGGNNGLTDIPGLAFGTFKLNTNLRYYYFVSLLTVFLTALSIHLIHSRIGRACRAIHSSRQAAQLMGVNVQKLKVQVFMMSAAYASIAGSLYAHYQKYLDPTNFGFKFSVELVVMVVLGGLGSVWGGILGAAIISLLIEYSSEFAKYGPIIYGLVLMSMVLVMPNGVAGLFGQLLRLFSRKKKEAEA